MFVESDSRTVYLNIKSLTLDLAVIPQEDTIIQVRNDVCTCMLISALFVIEEYQKRSKCSCIRAGE